jgi:hypothetical protein
MSLRSGLPWDNTPQSQFNVTPSPFSAPRYSASASSLMLERSSTAATNDTWCASLETLVNQGNCRRTSHNRLSGSDHQYTCIWENNVLLDLRIPTPQKSFNYPQEMLIEEHADLAEIQPSGEILSASTSMPRPGINNLHIGKSSNAAIEQYLKTTERHESLAVRLQRQI